MNKVSLIISVYKNIKSLELILTALSIQTFKDFEVVIADDGSGEEMYNFIDKEKSKRFFEISYVTQEDIGFRKNKILNEAIKKTKTDYLIFIDGDCIPHTHFLQYHYENMSKNGVLCGRRAKLSRKISEEITLDKILNHEYQKIKIQYIIDSFISKDIHASYIKDWVIIKNKYLRKLITLKEPHILGCNFSLYKRLMETINGFDENYEGSGIGEDSDIEYRLRLMGAEFYSIRNLAIVLHLYHQDSVEAVNNFKYFEQVKSKGQAVCNNGLNKLDVLAN